MEVYKKMIEEVLMHGTRKENRTGVDTLSTFNYNYELCWDSQMFPRGTHPFNNQNTYMVNGGNLVQLPIPLLTTKDISWKNIVVEMLWFLSGSTNIDILKRHKCRFWDPWADENGQVPSAYGNFWRNFPVHKKLDARTPRAQSMGTDVEVGFNDQLGWVVDQLRNNPMSRRLVVSAWAPGNAQTSKLPPCHLLFVFNVQNVEESLDSWASRAVRYGAIDKEKIEKMLGDGITGRYAVKQLLTAAKFEPHREPRLCLHLTQRSCDLALGVPYNMASYGLLLLIMSHLTGIRPGIFAHTLLDLHVYTSKFDGSMAEYDHVPGLQEQLKRTPKQLPLVQINSDIEELSDIEALMDENVSTDEILENFKLTNYNPHPAIKFKVAV